MFDAQPTASERQRENLSSRLRREFGLALPEDDDARPATDPAGTRPNPDPFGPLADLKLPQTRDFDAWAPNLKTHSQDAWPNPSGVASVRHDGTTQSLDGTNFARSSQTANSLPGYDNLVLLGQTAQNMASLEISRNNVGNSSERLESPNPRFDFQSGRTVKWGRRGV